HCAFDWFPLAEIRYGVCSRPGCLGERPIHSHVAARSHDANGGGGGGVALRARYSLRNEHATAHAEQRKRDDAGKERPMATNRVRHVTLAHGSALASPQSSRLGSVSRTSSASGRWTTASSFRIFPSRKTSTRLANCAMSCSCVTRTIVRH